MADMKKGYYDLIIIYLYCKLASYLIHLACYSVASYNFFFDRLSNSFLDSNLRILLILEMFLLASLLVNSITGLSNQPKTIIITS